MNSSTIPHEFNGKLILQLSENTLVGGKQIPKGYVNATQMCKANGKRLDNYLRNQKAEAFIQETSTVTSLLRERLIIVIQGGDDKNIQGTWFHPNIANNLAQWISPKFAAWASQVLTSVLRGDYQALTKEAEIAQIKLQETWTKVRSGSKQAFWSLGDAIKSYLTKHESSANYQRFIYPNCQDALNRGLFGKAAKTIREELGVSDLLRDHYGEVALRRIDLVQALAAANIVNLDVEPLDSVKNALEVFNFNVVDYCD